MDSIKHKYLGDIHGVHLHVRAYFDETMIDEDVAGDDPETLNKLYDNELSWYRIELSAEKAGIELAVVHLTCCISEHGNEIDSYLDSGYLDQMKEEVLNDANIKLTQLKE